MFKLLLLDDDPFIHALYQQILNEEYQILTASNFLEAVFKSENQEIDGVIVDLHLGDTKTGYDFLVWFKENFPQKPIVIQSGSKEISLVVKCIQAGAEDFIEKPLDPDTILLKLKRVFIEQKKKSVYMRSYQKLKNKNEIIGKNSKILKAKELVEKSKTLRILFLGETGVGKTPFAWYSNQVLSKEENSPRPFEQINCSGLNTLHFEDILFGHKKGAFTGVVNDKKGLVELAKGGDIFLDEIGELNLETQSRFLTFLDTFEYYRLGDDQKRKAEVRILCATNQDLRERVERGLFRKDLFSRIAQVEIEIPPLRERMEDFVLLFEYFVKKYAGFQKPYTPEIIQRLKQFSWREGNVRELRDLVEYLCVVSRQVDTIGLNHLSEKYQTIQQVEDANSLSFGLENYLGNVEKKILENCIRESSHLTLEELAEKLGVSKPTLYRRIKKYDIQHEKD